MPPGLYQLRIGKATNAVFCSSWIKKRLTSMGLPRCKTRSWSFTRISVSAVLPWVQTHSFPDVVPSRLGKPETSEASRPNHLQTTIRSPTATHPALFPCRPLPDNNLLSKSRVAQSKTTSNTLSTTLKCRTIQREASRHTRPRSTSLWISREGTCAHGNVSNMKQHVACSLPRSWTGPQAVAPRWKAPGETHSLSWSCRQS